MIYLFFSNISFKRKKSVKNLKNVLDKLSFATFAIDKEHNVIFWNEACEILTGIKSTDIIGTNQQWKGFYSSDRPVLADLILAPSKGNLQELYGINKLTNLLGGENEISSLTSEGWVKTLGLEPKFLAFEAKPIFDDKGNVIGAFEILFNLTEHKKITEKLKLSYKVFEKISDGVMITNESNDVVFINNSLEKMSGYKIEDVINKNPRLFVSKKNNPKLFNGMWKTLGDIGFWKGEILNKVKSGEEFLISCYVTKVLLDGGTYNYIYLMNDITEQRNILKKLHFLAHYDCLTKLPNRTFLEDKIQKAIKKIDKKGGQCAVMFLDLDKFKNVNDSLGHDVGDLLLKEVSKRLKHIVKAGVVARQGGDEFVILIDNVEKIEDVTSIAINIKKSFNKSFLIKKHNLSITTSIGIALYPNHANDFQSLIKNADTAMYWTKYNTNGDFVIYEENMNSKIIENISIIDKLNDAIKTKLNVYFQPQYSLKNKCVIGSEALIRWQDDDWGWVSPDKFIPLAEEFGLISTIGAIVLDKSCQVIRDSGLKVGVNLSTIQFLDEDLVKNIKKSIKKYKINPSLLLLEITEGALISNFVKTKEVLEEIRDLGVRLALDDFGTGYSSLAYLSQFPFDYLKIDQSFVKDVKNKAIVTSIIDMAEKLNLETIGEGVETIEQLMILKYAGCSIVQGFLYSKALTISDYFDFLKNEKKSNLTSMIDDAIIGMKTLGLVCIDIEHKELIDELDMLESKVNLDLSFSKDISMHNFYTILIEHFNSEESLMLLNNYTLYKEHKLEHDLFLEKYILLTGISDVNNNVDIFSILSYARRWLTGHILSSDKKFVEFKKKIDALI